MAETEAKLDLSDYYGSCDANEMKAHLKAELSESLQQQYTKIAKDIADLRSENNSASSSDITRERAKLMEELVPIKAKLAQIDEKIQKNNSVLTKFYNIRESATNDPKDKDKKISIEFNENGEAVLKVSVEKQMDGSHFDFSIHDGKVVLGNMSPEQMMEAIDFLSRRGLRYELPPQADNEVKKYKEEVLDKRESEEPKIAPEEQLNDVSPELADKPLEQMTEEERRQITSALEKESQQNSAATIGFNPEAEAEEAAYAASNADATPAPAAEKPEEKEKTFEDAKKDFRDWAENRLGKEKGFGLHISWGGLGNTFSFYQDNNQDWYSEDGKHDKKGKHKEDGLLFRVKLHKGKDGKLGGISYYVPKNGKIPDNLAGKMAAMVKAQGAVFMNFPEDLPDTDPGVFRKACAQNGVIPTGKNFNFNENQARNMIKEAEANLNSDATLKYKGQMGRYLLKRERDKGEKGNKSIMAYAQSLIDEQKLDSLKNCFETHIMPEIDQLNADAKAEDIIGASDASNKLFEIFTSDRQRPIGEALNNLGFTPDVLNRFNLSAEQQQAFQNIRATQSNDLKADELQLVYTIMKMKYTQDAKKKLDDRTASKNDDQTATYVDKEVDTASKKLQNLGRKFSRKGVQSIGFPEFSTGRYEKPAVSGRSHSASMAMEAARQRLAEKRGL
ncbi:MAG: hypothetical protein IJ545_06410 [Alphaproteobacteria bacterium]|nr:hypothetical protein [Alphaproteobacteria bacterium]